MRTLDISTVPPTDSEGATLTVSGEIDVATSPQLRHELRAAIEHRPGSVIVDLHQVSFIDSSGLGVLVGALRQLREQGGSGLVLRGMQESVRRLFDITGLATVFTIED
jgi:anti-sigma B factor antagonist